LPIKASKRRPLTEDEEDHLYQVTYNFWCDCRDGRIKMEIPPEETQCLIEEHKETKQSICLDD